MTIDRLLDFKSSFQQLQTEIYSVAKAKGFREHEDHALHVPARLCLVMSEAVEAMEAHRNRKDSEIGHELADIVIRVMDLSESLGIDLGAAIVEKHEFNKTRPFKHGDKRY